MCRWQRAAVGEKECSSVWCAQYPGAVGLGRGRIAATQAESQCARGAFVRVSVYLLLEAPLLRHSCRWAYTHTHHAVGWCLSLLYGCMKRARGSQARRG